MRSTKILKKIEDLKLLNRLPGSIKRSIHGIDTNRFEEGKYLTIDISFNLLKMDYRKSIKRQSKREEKKTRRLMYIQFNEQYKGVQ